MQISEPAARTRQRAGRIVLQRAKPRHRARMTGKLGAPRAFAPSEIFCYGPPLCRSSTATASR